MSACLLFVFSALSEYAFVNVASRHKVITRHPTIIVSAEACKTEMFLICIVFEFGFLFGGCVQYLLSWSQFVLQSLFLNEVLCFKLFFNWLTRAFKILIYYDYHCYQIFMFFWCMMTCHGKMFWHKTANNHSLQNQSSVLETKWNRCVYIIYILNKWKII